MRIWKNIAKRGVAFALVLMMVGSEMNLSVLAAETDTDAAPAATQSMEENKADIPVTDGVSGEDADNPATDKGSGEDADDPATDEGSGEGADDPATDEGSGEGADDPATDEVSGEGADDPATDEVSGEGADDPATDEVSGEDADDPATDAASEEDVDDTAADEDNADNTDTEESIDKDEKEESEADEQVVGPTRKVMKTSALNLQNMPKSADDEEEMDEDSGIATQSIVDDVLKSETEKEICNELKTDIKNIASGNSVKFIPEFSVDLGDAALAREVVSDGTLDKIAKALFRECPFETFWCGDEYQRGVSGNKVIIKFSIAKKYQDPSNPEKINPTLLQEAKVAETNAKNILSKYSGSTGKDKLTNFKNEICSLTSYNWDQASKINSDDRDTDAWQAINVFNGKNVVCEGYSKAFQYLCDEAESQLGGIKSYIVTGTMTPSGNIKGGATGDHMWNIVVMNGKSYLVDVTNCDSLSTDALFLATPVSGNVKDGYTFKVGDKGTIKFTYDMETLNLYGSDSDILKFEVDSSSSSTTTTTPPTVTRPTTTTRPTVTRPTTTTRPTVTRPTTTTRPTVTRPTTTTRPTVTRPTTTTRPTVTRPTTTTRPTVTRPTTTTRPTVTRPTTTTRPTVTRPTTTTRPTVTRPTTTTRPTITRPTTTTRPTVTRPTTTTRPTVTRPTTTTRPTVTRPTTATRPTTMQRSMTLTDYSRLSAVQGSLILTD